MGSGYLRVPRHNAQEAGHHRALPPRPTPLWEASGALPRPHHQRLAHTPQHTHARTHAPCTCVCPAPAGSVLCVAWLSLMCFRGKRSADRLSWKLLFIQLENSPQLLPTFSAFYVLYIWINKPSNKMYSQCLTL